LTSSSNAMENSSRTNGSETVRLGTIVRRNLAVDFERVSLIAQFFFT
jgi:hypothetical protein